MEKDFVFVDTSVFCKANYFVKDGTISHLFQLHDKGRILLLMPTITKREVQKNYRQDLVEQFDKLSRLHKLKNIETYNLPVMNKDDICKEVNCKISEMMNHVCELDYSYCQDVETIFEKYFEREYPFAGKGKEKEFPDAFVLQALEKYAADNQIKKVIVLSEDGDMTDYQSPVLDTSEDYKMYLSRKLKEDADLSGFEEALNDSLPNLERQINLKVEALLTNPGTYQEVINLNEVSDVSLNGFEVILNSKDYYITSINEHSIDIDLHAKVDFSVCVEYLDLESSYYDREYDQWLVRNFEFNNIVRSDNIVVQLKYSIDMLHLEVIDYGIDNLEDEINGRIF
jgi:hypothetical protein